MESQESIIEPTADDNAQVTIPSQPKEPSVDWKSRAVELDRTILALQQQIKEERRSRMEIERKIDQYQQSHDENLRIKDLIRRDPVKAMQELGGDIYKVGAHLFGDEHVKKPEFNLPPELAEELRESRRFREEMQREREQDRSRREQQAEREKQWRYAKQVVSFAQRYNDDFDLIGIHAEDPYLNHIVWQIREELSRENGYEPDVHTVAAEAEKHLEEINKYNLGRLNKSKKFASYFKAGESASELRRGEAPQALTRTVKNSDSADAMPPVNKEKLNRKELFEFAKAEAERARVNSLRTLGGGE